MAIEFVRPPLIACCTIGPRATVQLSFRDLTLIRREGLQESRDSGGHARDLRPLIERVPLSVLIYEAGYTAGLTRRVDTAQKVMDGLIVGAIEL